MARFGTVVRSWQHWRCGRDLAVPAGSTDVEDANRRFLLYGVLPLWVLPEVTDWWMHGRTRIEHATGVKESAVHALMLAEAGLPVAMGLLAKINPLVLSAMGTAAVAMGRPSCMTCRSPRRSAKCARWNSTSRASSKYSRWPAWPSPRASTRTRYAPQCVADAAPTSGNFYAGVERLRPQRGRVAGPRRRAGPSSGTGSRPVSGAMHIVLDDTAMAAAGQGNLLASRLIHRAHAEPDWFLYAPVCALVEADRARPRDGRAPRRDARHHRPRPRPVGRPGRRTRRDVGSSPRPVHSPAHP